MSRDMHFTKMRFPSNSVGILKKEHFSGRIYISRLHTIVLGFFLLFTVVFSSLALYRNRFIHFREGGHAGNLRE